MLGYILVTGGAGYIGSHACKALSTAGYVPVAYDNLTTGNRTAVKWGPFVKGDLSDKRLLVSVLEQYRPMATIHFAASAYVGESARNPEKYYLNNVAGTLSLLSSLRTIGLGNVVFSSTCATYGVPSSTPIHENQPQHPINPYGRSKLMVEQILRDYTAQHGFSAVILRYFNAAGADPDNETGEVHDPETHLVPLALEAARNASRPITVFGTDYPTHDGTCVRDFVHVSDLADAHVMALQKTASNHGFETYNLGSGVGHSVHQIIEAVESHTKKSVARSYGTRRPGDPPILVASAEKARRHLGWEPRYSDMATIVRTAWNWTTR